MGLLANQFSSEPVMVVHTSLLPHIVRCSNKMSSSILGYVEFKASPGYMRPSQKLNRQISQSLRPAGSTKPDPVSENKQQKNETKKNPQTFILCFL